MIESVVTLTQEMYDDFIANLLSVIGDYHFYNYYISEESSTGEIVLQTIKHLDIPWIAGFLYLLIVTYCMFRIISTVISKF